MPYMHIHLGGVALGFAIVLAVLLRWAMKEKHRLAALVPFVLALLYGILAALAALSSWSLLGATTWVALWAGNVAGYAALVWGVGGESPDVTRAQQIVLTPGGHVIVLLLTVLMVALLRWGPAQHKGKLLWGVLSGILIALSGTIAGIAAVPLGSGVNLAGAAFTEMFG
ncbi:hypothetical protein AB0E11_27665 [Streptomyces fradiae]|uniref:hypothetical protein n=1 Tax=Streptomyces fradiae TaxID=1906 RepID=UPI0029420CBA|nr:hypothetical protein [Streptomyces fradiae]WOI58622.1 hypothetical protein RYQ63_00980 [Streptomyces fradiae]